LLESRVKLRGHSRSAIEIFWLALINEGLDISISWEY